jgi:hypothetical protein
MKLHHGTLTYQLSQIVTKRHCTPPTPPFDQCFDSGSSTSRYRSLLPGCCLSLFLLAPRGIRMLKEALQYNVWLSSRHRVICDMINKDTMPYDQLRVIAESTHQSVKRLQLPSSGRAQASSSPCARAFICISRLKMCRVIFAHGSHPSAPICWVLSNPQ